MFFFDVLRDMSALGGKCLKVVARRGSGKHGVGSFPVRDVLGHHQQPGMDRVGRAVSTSPPSEPNAIREGLSDTCGDRAASEVGRYKRLEEPRATAIRGEGEMAVSPGVGGSSRKRRKSKVTRPNFREGMLI
jgi:hypothetical protein